MIYSLAQLKEMEKETKQTIANVISEKAQDHYVSARELADATDGLCSAYHIANVIANSGERWGYQYREGKYGNVKLAKRKNTIRTTKHLAELNDKGEIIRKFDVTTTQNVYGYKVINNN